MLRHFWIVIICLTIIGLSGAIQAQETTVWQTGEGISSTLFDAQRLLFTINRADDPNAVYIEAQALLGQARTAYTDQLQQTANDYSPEAASAVTEALADAQFALNSENPIAFAAARGRVWANLLWVSYEVVEGTLTAGDINTAQEWLLLREYRQATVVSFVDSSATLAIRAAAEGGSISGETAVLVLNDLRDTYYFRLRDALSELEDAAGEGHTIRAAEWAGQAGGYFQILRADFVQKQGSTSATAVDETFVQMQSDTLEQNWDAVREHIVGVRDLLADYQPVELSPELIAERGRLLYLFLKLVYIEYRDGVRNGAITIPIEYQEATTFLAQARSIYEELRPVIAASDPEAAQSLNELLAAIDTTIHDLGDAAAVQTAVNESLSLVQRTLQVEVNGGDIAATFTVIDTLLDEVIIAAEDGRYAEAERTRIEAYGLFESGPELRLANRAPILSRELEGLFWEGSGGQLGLYTLLDQEADSATLQTTVAAVRVKLAEAETFLGGALTTPLAALNSAIIIIREGLEAVLIIGAILAYMFKTRVQRRFIVWVFAGVVGAIALSIATWFAAETILTITPVQRELIEGITSLIAVAVLFYVTNWLFHKVYVVDWMQFVREQTDRSLNNGRVVGLAVLGFTVVYREGLETVLFYQALLFDAEPAPVLLGFAVGLVFILVVAYAILSLSKRLPLKPLFTITTILLLVLAFSFTGSGVRELQEAGVVSATLLPWFPENLLLMELFGLFPTLETVLAQVIFTALIVLTFTFSRWQGRRETAAATQKPKSQEVHS
ncbi:MAG: FTR1 family iron permease [Anaerolineae bacterium]|nr:FTR1 family iron permease [Anaerolineae bacterium]